MRVIRGISQHADLIENLVHPCIPFVRRKVLQTERNVLGDGKMREQGKILKQQADQTFFRRHIVTAVGKHIIVPGDPAGL